MRDIIPIGSNNKYADNQNRFRVFGYSGEPEVIQFPEHRIDAANDLLLNRIAQIRQPKIGELLLTEIKSECKTADAPAPVDLTRLGDVI